MVSFTRGTSEARDGVDSACALANPRLSRAPCRLDAQTQSPANMNDDAFKNMNDGSSNSLPRQDEQRDAKTREEI